MATKANNHPLVKDLRHLIKRHGMKGVVVLGITDDDATIAASAGRSVKLCDALGPVLDQEEIHLLFIEMCSAIDQAENVSNLPPDPFGEAI